MRKTNTFWNRNLLCALGSLWVLSVSAFAQGNIVVDQAVTESPPYYSPPWSAFGPSDTNYVLGQEFVPTLSAVDFVDLQTDDSASTVTTVQIRAGTIDGPLLGTSASLTGAFGGETKYLFPEPISLTPSNLYVIELTINPGDGFAIWGNFPVPDGAGRMIQDGIPLNGSSLWFQEGVIAVPEPNVASLFAIGIVVATIMRRFSRHGCICPAV